MRRLSGGKKVPCGLNKDERAALSTKEDDAVNHPDHYTTHPSGVECIQITEHMGFLDGNAMKYLWRHRDKGKPVEDLKKARWYIDRLIAKYEREEAE